MVENDVVVWKEIMIFFSQFLLLWANLTEQESFADRNRKTSLHSLR